MLDRIDCSAQAIESTMEPGYAAFSGAFGGWTAAHALTAALQGADPGLCPAALSIDFLAPIGPGSVRSQAETVRDGRSSRFVAVTTTQESRTVARTSVILVAQREGLRVEAATMPVCEPAARLLRLRLGALPVSWVERFDLRCAQGRFFAPNPGMRTLFWTRMDDTSPSADATLAAIADASFPRIYFHFGQVQPIATLTMSIHFHADEATLRDALREHVLVEAWSNVVAQGLFDQQVRIWSATGRLLGTSTQLARITTRVASA